MSSPCEINFESDEKQNNATVDQFGESEEEKAELNLIIDRMFTPFNLDIFECEKPKPEIKSNFTKVALENKDDQTDSGLTFTRLVSDSGQLIGERPQTFSFNSKYRSYEIAKNGIVSCDNKNLLLNQTRLHLVKFGSKTKSGAGVPVGVVCESNSGHGLLHAFIRHFEDWFSLIPNLKEDIWDKLKDLHTPMQLVQQANCKTNLDQAYQQVCNVLKRLSNNSRKSVFESFQKAQQSILNYLKDTCNQSDLFIQKFDTKLEFRIQNNERLVVALSKETYPSEADIPSSFREIVSAYIKHEDYQYLYDDTFDRKIVRSLSTPSTSNNHQKKPNFLSVNDFPPL